MSVSACFIFIIIIIHTITKAGRTDSTEAFKPALTMKAPFYIYSTRNLGYKDERLFSL